MEKTKEETTAPDAPIGIDTRVVLVDADYEQSAPVPLALRLIRVFFAVVGRILPGPAGALAEKMFYVPPRHREPARETQWLESARREDVPFDGGHLATYRWGRGPAVFLLHGWAGRGSQMGAFAQALVDAGYEAIAVDMPAHGRSSGRRTTGFIWERAVQRLGEHFGEPHAMITHSFGGTCTMLAMGEGFKATRTVLICPGVTSETFFRGFADIVGLPERALAVLRRRVVSKFGEVAWERFTTARQGQSLSKGSARTLLVHDIGDAEVSYSQSVQLTHHTERAELLSTRGLGHRRILRHPSVIAAIVAFVKENEAPAAV